MVVVEKNVVISEVSDDNSTDQEQNGLLEGEIISVEKDPLIDADDDSNPEKPARRTYDVSSDSDDKESDVDENEFHEAEFTFNDEEEMEVSSNGEKVGRWTYSGGAAKKSKTPTSSVAKKPTTEYQKEKFAIHSESQRLIRGNRVFYKFSYLNSRNES